MNQKSALARLAILVASAALLPAAAAAQVISFGAGPSQFLAAPTSFVESGFTIDYTPGGGGFAIIANPPACSPACASNGTNAFYSFNTGSLAISGGGPAGFALSSLDAAQTFTTVNRALDFIVTGSLVLGGTVSAQFTTAPGGGDVFQTFLLPGTFTGLSSVTIAGATPYPRIEFAVDNIVLNGGVSAVPEPSTLVLLVGGLGVLGAAARRRRAS